MLCGITIRNLDLFKTGQNKGESGNIHVKDLLESSALSRSIFCTEQLQPEVQEQQVLRTGMNSVKEPKLDFGHKLNLTF